MVELAKFLDGVSGPFPHIMLFLTIACMLSWWTKEIRATLILLVLMSIGGECLQLYFPRVFSFEFADIIWNITGSVIGVILTQIALFLCGGWIAREEGWTEIRKEMNHGDYS